MRHYLVAGATGRVGGVVARTLLDRNRRVTVVVRNADDAGRWQATGAEAVVGTLGDRAFLRQALAGVDGFFVLLPENVAPDNFHGARREMADAIAAAVSERATTDVVMLSAIAAVLPDGNGPASDLHYLERKLESSGARATLMRACYFLDNIAAVIPAARAEGVYPNLLHSQDVAFPMVATRDAGRTAADLLDGEAARGGIVDVLGPAYTVRQLAAALGAALGRPLRIVDIPPASHVAALTAAGVPAQLAAAVAEMLAAFASGRIVPSGDRRIGCSTTIEEVLASLVSPQDGSV